MPNINIKYEEKTNKVPEDIPFFFKYNKTNTLYYCFLDTDPHLYKVVDILYGATETVEFEDLIQFTEVYNLENITIVDVDIIVK
jgi:hypothetical protein